MLIFANFLLPTWIVKLFPLDAINFESTTLTPLILIPPPLINLIASEVLDTRSIFLSNWGIFTPSGSIIDNECSSISSGICPFALILKFFSASFEEFSS